MTRLPGRFEELDGLRWRGLLRESTVEQGNNSGPVVQRVDELAFAERWGLVSAEKASLEDGRFYKDLVSGSDALKRPQFLQMVADAKAGEFDVLIVRESSRFARNIEQAYEYVKVLHASGVVVVFTAENQLSSGPGTIEMAVHHAINDVYIDALRVNVRRGYRVKRFERGKVSGTPPIGYRMGYEAVFNPGKGMLNKRVFSSIW